MYDFPNTIYNADISTSSWDLLHSGKYRPPQPKLVIHSQVFRTISNELMSNLENGGEDYTSMHFVKGD